MTLNISRTWPLSNSTSNKNLLFESHSALLSSDYTPKEMQLVITFLDEESAQNFLHTDIKLSVFLGSRLYNNIYCQDTATIIDLQKKGNMFIVPFSVNSANEKQFVVGNDEKGIIVMVTFPAGKPTCIANSFLMVSGVLQSTLSSQCS